MNKNDLRFVKTEKNLYESYLKLLVSRKPITIVDLCKEAMINKSTFYLHYDTIYDLHREVCRKEVAKIINHIEGIRNIKNNTEALCKSVYQAFIKQQEFLDILFNHNPVHQSMFVEEEILKTCMSREENKRNIILIKFAIAGAARVLSENHDQYSIDTTIEILKEIAGKLSV